MKVLFAVNSESISDAIIKKYQKDYREILSYKNVYYFNAIQKEIQQDKTYDRIVISEDLEPFSNNNYESIDKFIFEKLDGISDEAHDTQGNEISIILISSDRHQKGSSFLVKIFGIGVYNALLGSDRSMEEVCRLINKPRTKKEAKMYYRIDTDDVNYRSEHEDEVSEIEIQNIISHFKKLGKDSSKYSNSFDNIAAQYTDEQLKIIINCLPISVKAILEESSAKYQEIMSVNGTLVRGIKGSTAATKQDQKRTGLKIDLIENKRNQSKITQPIVIPNSVKSKGSSTAKKVISIGQQPKDDSENKADKQVINKKVQPEIKKTKKIVSENKLDSDLDELIVNNKSEHTNKSSASLEGNSKKVVKKTIDKNTKDSSLPKKKIAKIENDDVKTTKTVKPVRKVIKKDDNKLDSIEELDDIELPDIEISKNITDKKVKRGRPSKISDEEEVQVTSKGKRGRPRKNISQDEKNNVEDLKENDELDFNLDTFEMPTSSNEIDEKDEIDFDDLIDFDEEKFIEEPEDVSIDELDELDDIEEQKYEDSEDDELEDVFDEFDEYDEYGTDKAKILSDEDKIDDLYKEDILDDEEDDDDILSGLDEEEYEEDDDDILSGLDEEEYEEDDDDILSGLDEEEEYEEDDDDDILSDLDEEEDNSDVLFSDDLELDDESLVNNELDEELDDSDLFNSNDDYSDNEISDSDYLGYGEEKLESIKPTIDYSMSNLSSLMAKDKKIVTFLGSPKNGVSFLVNNLAEIFASVGINTAILDMTKNKNSYYIYTQNEETLRQIAYTSLEKLQNGSAEGIRVRNNLTVYTALPNDGKDYSNAEPILSTLVQNHSLVLIDCDFDTNPSYFASCQEIYLVQSMDILTIQPLTAFLKELKVQGVLEPEKVKVVINKELKVRGLTNKSIIGGMSFYNDPAMSFMTELFNKDIVPYCSIPFEEMAYSKYLEGMLNCKVSINGYSKNFMNKLRILGDMVYPLTSRQAYSSSQVQDYGKNNFSNSMNDTLSKMKKKL